MRYTYAALSLAAALVALPAAAQRACPERVQIGFGETAADIARRCGVTPEALDRANPGLGLEGGRTQVGIHVTVPRPALPSPSRGVIRHGFVPVPTPPGALGR